jgi:AcrR family transcriptional regulator
MVSTKNSKLKGARARMYRDLIFESAEHVFGAQGFEKATMQDLASEAGISLKTLYATFPGKRELYDEIQRVRGLAFVECVLDATREGHDAIDRLERSVAAYVAFLFEHEDWLRIHLRERLAWGLGPRDGSATETWQRGLTSMADTIRSGIEEGVFFDGDPTTQAMMALAIMQVQVSSAVMSDDRAHERVAAEISTQLHRLLCRDRSTEARIENASARPG